MDSVAKPSERSRYFEKKLLHLQELNPPAGYVYVVRDVDISGTYKIGYTGHPVTRIATLDEELPIRIEPVLIFEHSDDAKGFENDLHRRFAKSNRFGEWFYLDSRHLEQLNRQYKKRLVFSENVEFSRAQAQNMPREITYVPPHIYRDYPKVNVPGYVYVIQDERETRLFRILWTNDPEKVNAFNVRIPIRTKVVLVAPASSEKADALNRNYAKHRRVGEWLDLNDEQLNQIRGSLRPAQASQPSPQPPANLPAQQHAVSQPKRQPAEQPTKPTRRRGRGLPALLAFIVCVGLAFILGTASGPLLRQFSQLGNQATTSSGSSVPPDPSDEEICDTSQYEYGRSGYILCSSVPDSLKPIREGHCLYQHLDDRDRDGKVCE